MDGLIVAENLGHVYQGGTVALDDVNLRIGTGLFGLLGSNGAGKSTFMRIICTLLVPTTGRVTVGGLDVVADRRAARKLFGYLPQEFGAWRLQRVEEVLDTLALLSGLESTAARRQRIAQVLAAVGLEKVAERKVKQLSGGMLRRLGVAQALVHEPQVLIMDEPTVGLDPEERLRFRQLMTDLSKDRVILLSTHIVADLGSGCSDLALIDHGKLQFRGAPSELVALAGNKVCEVIVHESVEEKVSGSLEVVSRSVKNGAITLRGVIKDGQVPAGARMVEDITLEEAYLAFMAGRGRHVEELEMTDS
jgi:ABC-type multidrug transport system ATPase subunit